MIGLATLVQIGLAAADFDEAIDFGVRVASTIGAVGRNAFGIENQIEDIGIDYYPPTQRSE